MSDAKHRSKLDVIYHVEIEISDDDPDRSVDKLESYLRKVDDYEIVNRAAERSLDIKAVEKVYPENKEDRWTGIPKKKKT